jgi:hypothetical protein
MTRHDAGTFIADCNNPHASVAKFNALRTALTRVPTDHLNAAPPHSSMCKPSDAIVPPKQSGACNAAHGACGL